MDFNINPAGILMFVVFWNTVNGQGYIDFPSQGVKYKLYRESKSWSEAVEACTKEYATLAMPTTIEQLHNLHSIFNGYPPSLMPENGEKNMVHLGFHSLFAKNEYVTLTGQSIDELDFPVPNSLISECGALPRYMDLTTLPCDKLAGYVCEINIIKRQASKNKYDSRCMSSTYTYKETGNCYRHHKSLKNWADARSICREEGAHLVVLDTSGESTIISSMLYMTSNPVWVGFHDIFTEGTFRSDTGGYLHSNQFIEWDANQPDGGAAENCGAITKYGKMIDEKCDALHTFVCEKETNIKPEQEILNFLKNREFEEPDYDYQD